MRVHPAVLSRIGTDSELPVLRAGAARAAAAGADLVVLDAVAEIYVKAGDWRKLAKMWHVRPAVADANLLVRLPVDVWPFDGRAEVGSAVLAADLLESTESRGVAAGLGMLKTLIARREPL